MSLQSQRMRESQKMWFVFEPGMDSLIHSSSGWYALAMPIANVLTPKRLWRLRTSEHTSLVGSLDSPSVMNTTSMQEAAGSMPHEVESMKSHTHRAAPPVCVYRMP